MSQKLTKQMHRKHWHLISIGVLLLLSFLILNSCQSTKVATDSETRPLADLMLLEMAVQRDQTKIIRSTVLELIQQPLSVSTYAHLNRQLKADEFSDIRERILTAWLKQHPGNRQARQASISNRLCAQSEPDTSGLIPLIREDNDLIIARFLRCLTEAQSTYVLASLYEQLPGDSRIQILYFNDLIANGHSDQALTAMTKIAPDEKATEILRIEAKLLQERQQITEAKAIYQQILRREPYDDEVNFALADILYAEENYQTAVVHLERVLTYDKNNRQAQYLMAASQYALGDWPESEFWFLKLLTANAYRNRSFYYLGEIAIRRNQTDQAIEYFTKVKRSDYFLSAQLQLWRIIAREQPELAAMGLQQLAKEFPEDRMVIRLAEIEVIADSGEPHKALQELVNLADDYPDNLRLQLLRLRWLVEQDRLGNITQNVLASLSGLAEQDSQFQMLESSVFYLISQDIGQPAVDILDNQKYVPRDNTRYLFLEGVANAIGGNYDRAIQGLEQLLQLAPDTAAYLNALGYTLTLAGERYPEARSLIQQALALEPNNAAYLDSLAWLYYKEGNPDKAIELLRQALIYDQSASIYSHLIEILLSQGETELATQELRKAAQLFPGNRILAMLQEKI